MTPTQCENRVLDLIVKANELFGLNLDMPNVEFFGNSKVGGRANSATHTVLFNTDLMARHSNEYDNTIIHEVAHLVARKYYPYAKQHHGPEFKRVMAILGGRPNRCHSYNTVGLGRKITRHRYTCNQCSKEFLVSVRMHRNMQTNEQRYRCTTCSCNAFSYHGYVVR